MLDFWANASKLKRWLGFFALRDIYSKCSPHSIAYDLRKSVCEYSDKHNILFINWIDHKSQKIEGEELEIVLKFLETNKHVLFTLDLNKELYKLIVKHRQIKNGGKKILDDDKNEADIVELEGRCMANGGEQANESKEFIFKISNQEFRDNKANEFNEVSTFAIPAEESSQKLSNSVENCKDILKRNDIEKIDLKKLNKAVKNYTFTLKLDSVNTNDFKQILVRPNPKKKHMIDGIDENEICDSGLTLEKKLIEELFDSMALRLAKRAKEWITAFVNDKSRPKGNRKAKYEILNQFNERIKAIKRDKPSEIMDIKFDEIIEEIENKGMEVDIIVMDFIEAQDFMKKSLCISLERQEERLDQDFEEMIKNYSDQKEIFRKKNERIISAANTLEVSAGISEMLTEKYEKMFLDEVFENKLDINIPAYFECLNKYKKLMIQNEAKLDLRLLLKLAREKICDEDLRQLLMFGYKGNMLKTCNDKESQAKEKLLTPYKHVNGNGMNSPLNSNLYNLNKERNYGGNQADVYGCNVKMENLKIEDNELDTSLIGKKRYLADEALDINDILINDILEADNREMSLSGPQKKVKTEDVTKSTMKVLNVVGANDRGIPLNSQKIDWIFKDVFMGESRRLRANSL